MSYITEAKWFTGSLKNIKFESLIGIVNNHVKSGSKVFIGTDSFVTKGKVIFATSLCLHGNTAPSRYFFFRQKLKASSYIDLVSRITEETTKSIELARVLIDDHSISSNIIELHLDVSDSNSKGETSRFSDMLKGYVSGYGFSYKVKPHSWAAQTIADKHSK